MYEEEYDEEELKAIEEGADRYYRSLGCGFQSPTRFI
jgi:hypothetical protein